MDLQKTEEEIVYHTSKLEKWAKEDEACRRLQTIDGIGHDRFEMTSQLLKQPITNT
jgi:hypothetical protein